MKESYIKLPETVTDLPVGIPQMTAKLVERTDKKAIYYRWDGVYEVFRIEIQPDSTIMKRFYPAHEIYPGNEKFGSIAWCYHDKTLAMERYSVL
jgi:hypothetical protein